MQMPTQPVQIETAPFDVLHPQTTEGNKIVLLQGGQEFFPALIAQIDAAQREVHLETYIFEYDDSGHAVADALGRAAMRGVEVRLVTDGYGTSKLNAQMLSKMASEQVQHEVFRPEKKAFSLNRQRLRRLHRKLCVVDGAVAFVGGINVLDDFYDPNHGKLTDPRFDFAVQVQGPVVADVHVAVTRMWWQLSVTNRPFLRKKASKSLGLKQKGLKQLVMPESIKSTITPIGSMRAMFVLRDNFRFRGRIEAAYLLALHRARREVIIANAYFFPGRRFRRSLIDAARRGVKVRLLLQGRKEYLLQHYASHALYEELLNAGIEIFEYKRSFLHAKVAVIDDWATVGSSNIDPFSLLLAREANLLVEDAQFAAQLKSQILKGASEGGHQVLAPEFKRRPWWVHLGNRLAYSILRVGVALTGAAGRY